MQIGAPNPIGPDGAPLVRCMARNLDDPTLPKCPRRLECERYVLWVGTEVGERAPVRPWMCKTEQYEFRIQPHGF